MKMAADFMPPPEEKAADSIGFGTQLNFFLRFPPKKRMSSPEMAQLVCIEQHPRGMLVMLEPLYLRYRSNSSRPKDTRRVKSRVFEAARLVT